jgi:hypothetical protein
MSATEEGMNKLPSSNNQRALTGIKGKAAVESWNRVVPVGANVDVTLDDGSIKQTKTRSEAFMLGGHTAVVFLEGFPGAYSLSRVTMNGKTTKGAG